MTAFDERAAPAKSDANRTKSQVSARFADVLGPGLS